MDTGILKLVLVMFGIDVFVIVVFKHLTMFSIGGCIGAYIWDRI